MGQGWDSGHPYPCVCPLFSPSRVGGLSWILHPERPISLPTSGPPPPPPRPSPGKLWSPDPHLFQTGTSRELRTRDWLTVVPAVCTPRTGPSGSLLLSLDLGSSRLKMHEEGGGAASSTPSLPAPAPEWGEALGGPPGRAADQENSPISLWEVPPSLPRQCLPPKTRLGSPWPWGPIADLGQGQPQQPSKEQEREEQ